MAQVYLITGASTGFGAASVRALAKAGHTVFAGIYAPDGNLKPYEDEIATFASENKVNLTPIPLNLLSEDSITEAVDTVISKAGQIDVLIHNAGIAAFGPAESFTSDQYVQVFQINVLGPQRLNQAVLPHMRKRRSGHIVWTTSSTVYGAKLPFGAPYMASKAALDSLAMSYAGELANWGIETTILQPGLCMKTGLAAHQIHPSIPDVAKEYMGEGAPTAGFTEKIFAGLHGMVPDWVDSSIVADALVELAAKPRGKKPFRITADATEDGSDVAAAVVDLNRTTYYRRLGISDQLTVTM
ncbi:NAD(P)-binding protein [Polychaeton citri CBS 116435]|uniref:NAD(P)-binding protein n=1 Tax=Polychaeton citri CBS 116435 TaxID=1314669 RepID=A0A9P4QA05_9PEZI|nr:NAD(P)-binding protein [Polychaeton citri CBS 116435]